MKSILKVILGLVVGLGLVGSVHAATTTDATIADLMRQISELQAKINELQAQRQTVFAELTRNLALGATGDDVKKLQEFLASQPGMYPERMITGYYGNLTKNAVRKFQMFHGLDGVGNVGPLTRDMIRAMTASSTASTTALAGTVTICHIPKGNPGNMHTLNVGSTAVAAHQAHGDTLGACGEAVKGDKKDRNDRDDDEDNDVDSSAPKISSIDVDVSSSTAVVTWRTNEMATAKLYYSSSTPLLLASSTVMSFNLNNRHTANIGNLATSTNYYYIIVAADAKNNIASTSQRTWKTESN